MPCDECDKEPDDGCYIWIEATRQNFCKEKCVFEQYVEIIDSCFDVILKEYEEVILDSMRDKFIDNNCSDCEERAADPDDGGWRD